MKTIYVKEQDAVRNWYIIDAADKPLGRVAAKAAAVLRGKHKPTYTPNQEMGDYIVIIKRPWQYRVSQKGFYTIYCFYFIAYFGWVCTYER